MCWMSFFSDTIAHAALAGVAAGFLLGFQEPTLPVLAVCSLVAVAMLWLRERTELLNDTIMAVLLSTSVAGGLVMLHFLHRWTHLDRYLFGDILTDLSGVVTGSIGLAASANINPEKKFPSMFEPVHGSAPDIAGKGIANPLAAILTVVLLLDHLGESGASLTVRNAVARVLKEGKTMPPDLGGSAKTVDVGDAVLEAITGQS